MCSMIKTGMSIVLKRNEWGTQESEHVGGENKSRGNKANESTKHLGSSTEQNTKNDVVLLARGLLSFCHNRRRRSTMHRCGQNDKSRILEKLYNLNGQTKHRNGKKSSYKTLQCLLC